MSPEGRKILQATQFKKGNINHKNTFDGNVTIRRDSRGYYYKQIRLSKSVWQKIPPIHLGAGKWQNT